MIFGPITDREQLGWQRRTVQVLAGLLERASTEGLPPIQWTVRAAGAALDGRCEGRDAFEAWSAALDAPARPPFAHGSITRLRTQRHRYQDVTVVLLADIWANEEQGAGEGGGRR